VFDVKKVVLVLLIVVLVGLVAGYAPLLSRIAVSDASQSTGEVSRVEAFQYLVDSYNSTLGLCYEHPEPDVSRRAYWLTNDNVLASYVLQNWNREIADNISETVKRLAKDHNLTTSSAGIPLDTRAEILLGYNVDFFFNETETINLTYPYYGSILGTEIATNKLVGNFTQYADLVCYASLVEWRRQNYSGANHYYEMVKGKWDGNGFRDEAFNKRGYYATYKLGLFYFLNKVLDKGSFEFEDVLIRRVWQCQDSNGGFKTDYYANGTFPDCYTNTETTSIILLSNVPLPEPSVKVGAYYYMWWGIPFNDHWKECVKGTPLLWQYNSSDPEVADRHIVLAKQHGIDFFTISWMGQGLWVDWDFDDIDQNLNSFLTAPHLADFNFCLFYETRIVLDTANEGHKNFTEVFLNDIEYAAQKYLGNPSYLRVVDGNCSYPVLFIYNLPYLYSNLGVSEAHGLLDALRQRSANLNFSVYLVGDLGPGPSPPDQNSPLLYSLNASTSYFFDDPSKGWDSILANCGQYYHEWQSIMNSKGMEFIPNAYPGFNNTGLKDVTQPVVLPPDAMRFKEMVNIASTCTDDHLKMVMVTSWNEWLEATAIEPSTEYGESFLHAIPEFSTCLLLTLFFLITTLVTSFARKKHAHFATS
jgi:hypothetical protein